MIECRGCFTLVVLLFGVVVAEAVAATVALEAGFPAFVHSSLIVDASNVPLRQSSDKFSRITELECTSA